MALQFRLSMLSKLIRNTLLLFLCLFTNNNCRERATIEASKFNRLLPNYELEKIQILNDTVRFQLNENTYNSINSFNGFTYKNEEFISFYDDRSSSINIYHFPTQKLTKRILLKKSFSKLYKTSVYCKSFDSIFVTNKDKLFMLDSSGNIKLSIKFLSNSRLAYATLENIFPPIFKDSLMFTGVRPYVSDKSFKALRKWKVLYAFDLKNKKATLHYRLPSIYHKNLYGHQFLNYNYCYNHKGNFVFSFPVDTNVYESNLEGFHVSYFAKSKSQVKSIQPLSRKEIEDGDVRYKKYITQDSYGPIYYDPFHKSYIRIVKPRISEEAFATKNRQRQYRLIIFNEQLQITGESIIPEKVSTSLMFTKQGRIYARINAKDEYALNFVRLTYIKNNKESSQFVENKSNYNILK